MWNLAIVQTLTGTGEFGRFGVNEVKKKNGAKWRDLRDLLERLRDPEVLAAFKSRSMASLLEIFPLFLLFCRSAFTEMKIGNISLKQGQHSFRNPWSTLAAQLKIARQCIVFSFFLLLVRFELKIPSSLVTQKKKKKNPNDQGLLWASSKIVSKRALQLFFFFFFFCRENSCSICRNLNFFHVAIYWNPRLTVKRKRGWRALIFYSIL